MSFLRRKGSDKGFSEPQAVSSLTAVIHSVAAFDRANEVLISGTSGTSIEDVAGVFTTAVSSGDTEAQVQEIVDLDVFIADTTNATSSDHNMHRMVLTDSVTVNNTASDDTSDAAIIQQIAPVGASSDNKILCRFVRVQDRS